MPHRLAAIVTLVNLKWFRQNVPTFEHRSIVQSIAKRDWWSKDKDPDQDQDELFDAHFQDQSVFWSSQFVGQCLLTLKSNWWTSWCSSQLKYLTFALTPVWLTLPCLDLRPINFRTTLVAIFLDYFAYCLGCLCCPRGLNNDAANV
jgi:hypothetical protein